MFDANGNYAPPDAPTRHITVVTKTFFFRGRGPHQVSAAAGAVTWLGMLGQTQFASMGPPLQPDMALIEHETAQVGDVLPMDEVMPAVALAQKKQAAVQAFWAAEREKQALVAAAKPAG